MPDNDIVPRGVRRNWREASKLLLGGHEPVFVSVAIERALAHTVRDCALPPSTLLAHLVRESLDQHSTAAFEEAQRDYLRRAGGAQLARDVLSEVQIMYETERQEFWAWSASQLGNELTARALRRCTDRSLFGPDEVMERMMRDGLSYLDVERRRRECLDAPRYNTIAQQIETGKSKTARSPARPWSRGDLDEVLRQEVD